MLEWGADIRLALCTVIRLPYAISLARSKNSRKAGFLKVYGIISFSGQVGATLIILM